MGEAVLRNAVFGGYAKKDVMEYIDSVWSESEHKQEALQSRIEALKAENTRLRLRLRLQEADDRHPSVIRQKGVPGLTLEQTMSLPEGSYLVEGSDTLLRLPTPGSEDADGVWAQTAAAADFAGGKRPTETAAEQESPDAAPAEEGAAVRSLQKQLAEERKARAELEIKLAYSTDLLLKIYKR